MTTMADNTRVAQKSKKKEDLSELTDQQILDKAMRLCLETIIFTLQDPDATDASKIRLIPMVTKFFEKPSILGITPPSKESESTADTSKLDTAALLKIINNG